MIRLSKLTDYGLVLMTIMGKARADAVHTARELSASSRVPLPTVSKILKELLQSGLLVSYRGINGGYSLVREPRIFPWRRSFRRWKARWHLPNAAAKFRAANCRSPVQSGTTSA